MSNSARLSGQLPFALDRPRTWTVAGIRGALADGQVSATAILDDCRDRVAASALNAIVATDWERAYRRAAETDRLVDAGAPVGRFAGVPFTVKDVIAAAGVAATAGSRALLDNVPDVDATAVGRLRDAEGILIGKTNCPEFAITPGGCRSPAFGETRNPIDPDRTPGSSSGGEAAAVAAGLSVVGLGTDLGGSIRGPAEAVGIVSLRPTPGRIPSSGQFPGSGGELGHGAMPLLSPATLQGRWQVVSPIARCIDDLQEVLSACSGPDGIDQAAAPVPVRDYRATPLASIVVGWTAGARIATVSDQVSAAVGDAAARLVGHCAEVRSVEKAFRPRFEVFNDLRAVDPLVDHVLALGDRIDSISPALREIIDNSYRSDPERLARAWGAALAEQARALTIFGEVDVVILPVNGADDVGRDGTARIAGVAVADPLITSGHLRAVSILGAPAVAVPVTLTSTGVPIAVQVVAAPWHEEQALAVAAVLHSYYLGELA